MARVAKVENLKPFTKGDPRINRKGRPKTFDALRELAQQIAHEEVTQDGKPFVINGHTVTVTEAIMRSWAKSKDPRMQQAFIEVAYGKAANVTEISGKDGGDIRVQITYADNDNGNAPAPARMAAGSDTDGE